MYAVFIAIMVEAPQTYATAVREGTSPGQHPGAPHRGGPSPMFVAQHMHMYSKCVMWKSAREQVGQGFLSPDVTMRGVVDKFTIQGFPCATTA